LILSNFLNDLIAYTLLHFTTEESFLNEYNYPDSKDHIIEHYKIIKKVIELKYKSENRDVVPSIDVMELLENWLLEHILVSDREYVDFLKSHGVK
jgi:hemerythrin-like metal-binding protein